MNERCIAVDIGGTKIIAAEVTEKGEILHSLRRTMTAAAKRDKLELAAALVREYEQKFGWSGGTMPPAIGVGYNGIVDPGGGRWTSMFPGDTEEDARGFFESALGISCYVDNDVKCTVIAENEFGAGLKSRDLVYINICTGIAAGMITGGKLIRGSDGFAGEVGFMQADMDRRSREEKERGFPRDNDIEMFGSGMGLESQFVHRRREYPDSLLYPMEPQKITGELVYKTCEKGDAFAGLLVGDLVRAAGTIITDITCVLSPERVVIGGGLVRSEEMRKRIEEAVTQKALSHLEKGIVLTGLDTDFAGLMGAAAIGLGYQEMYG